MGSIVEAAMQDIAGVANGFQEVMQPISDAADDVREFLVDEGIIHKIADYTLFDTPSLATIDGACITNQLSHFDLIISGATLGEGASSPPVYTEDDYPSAAMVSLVQHDSGNNDVARALMAAQEVSLISRIPHEIRIMDGSWLSSATSLILTFSKSNLGSKLILDYVLKQRHEEGWDGFEIVRGLDRIFAPWLNSEVSPYEIIALSKSDSSRVIARKVSALIPSTSPLKKTFAAAGFMDRLLASVVLDSGEMLAPSYIDAGRSLYPRLNTDSMSGINNAQHHLAMHLSAWEKEFYQVESVSELSSALRKERQEFLDAVVHQMLFSGYLPNDGSEPLDVRTIQERVKSLDSTEGAWIWASYFKPHAFSRRDKALRLEFARDVCEEDSSGALFEPTFYAESAQTKASYLCGLVSGDIVSSEIVEPWSQYIADRRAKEVSALSGIITGHMLATSEDELLLDGIWRKYRT